MLDTQNLDTQKIRAILYSQTIMPFFIIPLIIIIFISTTINNREFNATQFISLGVFFTLMVWGVVYFLQKLAFNGIVSSELAIILPIAVLFVFTYYLYNKRVT